LIIASRRAAGVSQLLIAGNRLFEADERGLGTAPATMVPYQTTGTVNWAAQTAVPMIRDQTVRSAAIEHVLAEIRKSGFDIQGGRVMRTFAKRLEYDSDLRARWLNVRILA